MARCCPYLRHGECVIAIKLDVCRDGSGGCVVVMDRCCGVLESINGRVLHEWMTCRFYELGTQSRVLKQSSTVFTLSP